MKKKLKFIEPLIFYTILVLWMIPVWKLDFFVIGDGPCHLFNSKVLLDWYQGVNKDFYQPFYFLNTNFDPNWLYNLITMPLLAFFQPGFDGKNIFHFIHIGIRIGVPFSRHSNQSAG